MNNAVYAFANRTYLELIEPYDPESSAYRLLQRTGPGWHMLNVDLVHQNFESLDRAVRDSGVRVVQTNRTEHVLGAWHIHPRDTGGVLLNLADAADHDEHGMWAGWAWREFVPTNTRVVDRILGVSIVTDDLVASRDRWTTLGFEFGQVETIKSDDITEANCTGGTFLQLRAPQKARSPTGQFLDQRGPGLYHLCWGSKNLDDARDRLLRAGAQIDQTSEGCFWTTADSTATAVPMEFRRLR